MNDDIRYKAILTKDARFDGYFFTGVKTTGIYCRPSCPAITPKRENMSFHPTAAAARLAGFRACKRCRPDATPGSPEWNLRADLAARAMRLISDGLVDREGVAGLAARLGYTERHLHRVLVQELGAGALALATAQRTNTARILLETTRMRVTQVAYAAGFGSIRQFNDAMRAAFALTPSELRRRARTDATGPGISVRLALRPPFDALAALGFLGPRALPGLEVVDGAVYSRSLRLGERFGTMEISFQTDHLMCSFELDSSADLQPAVQRTRRMFDLDADPVRLSDDLAREPALRRLIRTHPGTRLWGSFDPHETAVRAVVGQQVSVAGARATVAKIAAAMGPRIERSDGTTFVVFPLIEAIAKAPDEILAMPSSRRDTLRNLATAISVGDISLDSGADRTEAREALRMVRGIGPWTAEYIAMRALGDPDAFPASDLGLVRAARKLGIADDHKQLEAHAERWRPWRAYAAQLLWRSL